MSEIISEIGLLMILLIPSLIGVEVMPDIGLETISEMISEIGLLTILEIPSLIGVDVV